MPKLIYTARFLDGREYSAKDAAYLYDSIHYNATREGTEIITLEKTLQYNAQRPGVDIIIDDDISHGLFNEKGKCNLQYEKDSVVEAYQNGSIIWKVVISLHEDDAIEKGLDSWECWKDLVCKHMPKISEQYNIDLNNLVWNAGFHTNTDNPHIHLTFYSSNPDEGRLSKRDTVKSFAKIKSSIVNDVFKEELEQLKLDKTKLRNLIKDNISNLDYVSMANNRTLKQVVDETLKKLPRSGRSYYSYMPEEVKNGVNKIFREIINSNSELNNNFVELRNNQYNFIKMYNEDSEVISKKITEFESAFFEPGKDDFKSYHNAILKELYKLNSNNEIMNEIEEFENNEDSTDISRTKTIEHSTDIDNFHRSNNLSNSAENIIDTHFKSFVNRDNVIEGTEAIATSDLQIRPAQNGQSSNLNKWNARQIVSNDHNLFAYFECRSCSLGNYYKFSLPSYNEVNKIDSIYALNTRERYNVYSFSPASNFYNKNYNLKSNELYQNDNKINFYNDYHQQSSFKNYDMFLLNCTINISRLFRSNNNATKKNMDVMLNKRKRSIIEM